MKRDKGFTLIELLAVIVILAIIALIATPLVLKYIETSRKDTFRNSIDSIERAAELKVMGIGSDKKFKLPVTIDVQDLDLKNKENLIGSITIYKNSSGNYEYSYNLTNKDYSILGKKDSEIKKGYPILKLKTENGVIDDINNYVYSFYDNEVDHIDYTEIELSNFFDVENGSLDYVKNANGNDSTGSKIILKDKNNNVIKEYTVIIFGDVDSDGFVDQQDAGYISDYVAGIYQFNDLQISAADVNNDGVITFDDSQILLRNEISFCEFIQYTRTCEDV